MIEISIRRDAGIFQASTSDLMVGLDIFAHGGHDKSIFFDSVQALRSLDLLKGDVFLDIGANNGFVTIYAMSTGMFRSAVCIEPDPENFRRLKNAIDLNRYEGVRCINAGVSNTRGELRLYRNPANFGDYRPAPTDADPNSAWEATTIAVDTLDETLREVGVAATNIGMACLDVQGWEGHVLEGARSLLAAKVPMLVEIWPAAMRANGKYDQAMSELAGTYNCFFARLGTELRPVQIKDVLSTLDASRDPTFQLDLLCAYTN